MYFSYATCTVPYNLQYYVCIVCLEMYSAVQYIQLTVHVPWFVGTREYSMVMSSYNIVGVLMHVVTVTLRLMWNTLSSLLVFIVFNMFFFPQQYCTLVSASFLLLLWWCTHSWICWLIHFITQARNNLKGLYLQCTYHKGMSTKCQKWIQVAQLSYSILTGQSWAEIYNVVTYRFTWFTLADFPIICDTIVALQYSNFSKLLSVLLFSVFGNHCAFSGNVFTMILLF